MSALAGGGFGFCVLLWLVWLVWLRLETWQHRRRLESIKLRIHVNGTRGKSGVTRLIAAGLRAGGRCTMAKVTGTEARLIYPDGSEKPIVRRGLPNILEYVSAVRAAAACGAEALVCECMALQPELQSFCEQRLLCSHIGVITNVRHDHEEIMGNDLVAIAATLGRTVPDGGILVTGPEAFAFLAKAGRIPEDKLLCHIVDAGNETELMEKDFPFEVVAENLVLALKVCELAEVSREVALAGMRASLPDGGNVTVQEHVVGRNRIRVVDATAANDPDSTQILWRRYVTESSAVAGILLHSRMDRRVRTMGLCALFGQLHAGPYFLTGDTRFAAKQLQKAGVSVHNIVRVPEATLGAVLARISATMETSEGTLFAAGNRKGFEI